MRLKGDMWWWVENTHKDGVVVKEAIIRNEEKEIILDYEYEGNKELMKLTSDDGIHFKGEYGLPDKKTGDCEFTLYKNAQGYLLYGGLYDSEGNCTCWIKLIPSNLINAVYEELKRLAREEEIASYSEIGKMLNLDMGNPADRNRIAEILDEINHRGNGKGMPMISSVVIRRDINMPGEGYFKCAGDLGKYAGGDKASFWARELTTVYNYWKSK